MKLFRAVIEYFFSCVIAFFCLPAILGFALLIYLYDRQNPFYISLRVGKNGKVFKMVKLRTMSPAKTEDENETTLERLNKIASPNDDERITSIGRLVRRIKIDEFAQIINVLKGDIKLVGPRPQLPIEVSRYTNLEKNILNVKPGITDISSIVFADQGDILKNIENPYLLYAQIELPWKSRLALLYVQHASFWLDIRLIFYTFTNMFARRWTLRRLSHIVEKWPSDVKDLPKIVGRSIPLYPYPVPGSSDIITKL
ncbi:MAG: sugar transferase [Puniceicoccales bacterium]|jgi:lipopolysaccharide/colanic/teichoic acid biosynthesis glycosyltransferase|nr:sugar transferase [Puniceicoccales bacterium]